MFELCFSDLTPEAQKSFLAACGLTSAADGNYDVLPITILSLSKGGDEGDSEEIQAALEEGEELELSDVHLERLDDIDNAVYQCILTLLGKSEEEFPWNMEYIGHVTDDIVDYLVSRGHTIYRPAVVTEDDGRQYISEYEGLYHEGNEA